MNEQNKINSSRLACDINMDLKEIKASHTIIVEVLHIHILCVIVLCHILSEILVFLLL